jgi:hypothetical protein
MLVVLIGVIGDNRRIQLMRNWKLWRYSRIGLLLAPMFLAVLIGAPAMAVTSSSGNYQLTETQFNSGITQQSCSEQYCARASIGSATDGKTIKSGTAQFEEVLGDEATLEVIIDPGESNLGVLTTETTATKTTTVRVRSFLSGGYLLQIMGEAPKFDEHRLETSPTPASSLAGKEQFGINVVANNLPTVGANPVQVPGDQGAFGVVEDGYDTPNQFMYRSEDVIARSTAESGRTDYTISMIVNISNATPAGHYTGDFAVVVVPIY